MPIQAIIFDFGDVLFPTQNTSGQRKWEQRLGLLEGELSQIVFESEVADRSMLGQATEADVWEHVASRLSLNPGELRQLQCDFWLGASLNTELVSFLDDLRPRYKTAILSNAWPGVREIFSHVLGLDQVTDEMIISAEEGVAKPDARIYQIAVDRLQVRPEEAIFVDDLIENVHGARAFGMVSFQFTSTQQVLTEVKGVLDQN